MHDPHRLRNGEEAECNEERMKAFGRVWHDARFVRCSQTKHGHLGQSDISPGSSNLCVFTIFYQQPDRCGPPQSGEGHGPVCFCERP